MRAVSLWQPWATAFVLGIKGPETRKNCDIWRTNYRGPLAIHAALRWERKEREFAQVEYTLGRLPARLPFGALVGVVDLDDVRATEEVAPQLTAIERLYGNYAPGRLAWIVSNQRALPEPIAYKGLQGFFTIPDDILPPEFRPRVLL
jgi:hypothetical protein